MEVINGAVSDERGIVGFNLEIEREQLVLDYNPELISKADIALLAEGLGPKLNKRWSTCTLRLGSRGGRACESCALVLEDRVEHIQGVRRATASYRGGVLTIAYDNAVTSPDELRQQIRQWGVSVSPSAAEISQPIEVPMIEPSARQRLRAWLTIERLEAIFVVITFVAMFSGLIAEAVLDMPRLSTIAYVIAYITGGLFGLRAGLESLRNRAIDVDILMILAALGAAYVGAAFEGAMLLFLFSLSNVLQNYALGRTRSAIRSLMELRPDQALVQRGDDKVIVPIERIRVGEQVIVRPGERIPLDGIVVEGKSSVNQASITGESMPVLKGEGDDVFAGTINEHGGLTIQVTKLARDSTIAKLIKMVEEAQSQKASTQRVIDKVEQYYAIAVIVLTSLTITIPVAFLGEDSTSAFYRGMTLLVAASPCAVVISTPATVLSAIASGARRGVLFKGGAYVEQVATVKTIAFDKTGTLTEGKPRVTDIIVFDPELEMKDNLPEQETLLGLAAAVEARSEHPLAKAITSEAKARQLELAFATNFQASAGLGVQAMVDGRVIAAGNDRFLERSGVEGLEALNRIISRMQEDGKTAVVLAEMGTEDGSSGRAGRILGVIGIADVLRPGIAGVVGELKSLGIKRTILLTGDNQQVAKAISAKAGVDEYY
ncbi:MAG: cation-translocating P-type ATPase, partial [Chloroflexota bacterium]